MVRVKLFIRLIRLSHNYFIMQMSELLRLTFFVETDFC